MKRLNYPLILGAIIIIFILALVIFEEQIIQLDPYGVDLGKPTYKDGVMTIKTPPQPPSESHLFGTDILGRDIFSQIVAGASITLKMALLITVFRFLIALPLAFFAGFGGKISNIVIRFFSTAFSTIPALIISIIILSFRQLRMLELSESIIAFAIVLTFVGWGRLANILKDRIKDILSQDFIQGEVAIGKSNFLIAVQNVMPHLIASIIVYAFLEMSRALLMLAQLGVFEVYVGKNKHDMETIQLLKLSILPSYNPEWGGMLASARYAITAMKPWVALFPALAFLISITGFNLLGEGLQYEISKRDSMVITWIKRCAFHLSPKTYIYEIKNFKVHKNTVIIKTLIIVLIIAVPLIPPPKSPYELDAESIFKHVDELSSDKYLGRLVSTQGRDEAANYIESHLREYNLKPLYKDYYIDEFNIEVPLGIINDQQLLVTDKSGEQLFSFKYKDDFNSNQILYEQNGSYLDYENYDILKEISGEILTLNQYKEKAFDSNKKYFAVMHGENSKGFYNTVYELANQYFIQGIIISVPDRQGIEYKDVPELINVKFNNDVKKRWDAKPYIINASKEATDRLMENVGQNVILKTNADIIGNIVGKNIGAIIEGDDRENPIVLATSYDYLGYDKVGKYKGIYENGSSVSSLLEIAKKLSEQQKKPKRTIVFTFLDSSQLKSKGASIFALNKLMDRETFYLYLNYFGLSTIDDNIYIDTSLITTNTKETYNYVKYIKDRSDELGMKIYNDQLTVTNGDVSKFKIDGGSGILVGGIGLEQTYQYLGMKQEQLNLLDKQKLKKHAQLIIDTIVHIAY